MHPYFQKLFEQIEFQRESVLRPFRTVSPEQFNLRPGSGKWSAAEVFSHLLAAEQLSIRYMHKKAEAIHQVSSTGTWEKIKMMVFILSQRLPGLKFKAPGKVVEHTKQLTSLHEIENAWKEIREQLRNLLEKIPADRVNRLIYKHPAVGYLDARHALVFFREHVIHHTPQLRKLVNKR